MIFLIILPREYIPSIPSTRSGTSSLYFNLFESFLQSNGFGVSAGSVRGLGHLGGQGWEFKAYRVESPYDFRV